MKIWDSDPGQKLPLEHSPSCSKQDICMLVSELGRWCPTGVPAPGLMGQNFCLWSILQINTQLSITSTQKNPWHFIPHSYNATPLLTLSFPKSSLAREQLRAACSGQRSRKHQPALSHAAATGEQLLLGTNEVHCALCTMPCFDQLPLGTWTKPFLNTVFEPLAKGSFLGFFCLKVSQ